MLGKFRKQIIDKFKEILYIIFGIVTLWGGVWMTEPEVKRMENFLDWYKANRTNYLAFSEFVCNKITNALQERNILIASSYHRAKTVSSLEGKCKKTIKLEGTNEHVLKYTDPKNQITDFAGARIVAYLKSDIPQIRRVVENLFEVDYENSGDKKELLSEKEIGYLSVHYIVSLKDNAKEDSRFKGYKCEVQIRTVLQDAWAQIFHDRQYKNNTLTIPSEDSLIRDTNLVAGALELIDNQIDTLVKQYDTLSKTRISNADYQELLDSEIAGASLGQYCKVKFRGQVNRYYNAEGTVMLLKEFGLDTIRDIDNITQNRFTEAICSSNQITIDKVVVYLLIIFNAEKYFTLSKCEKIKSISSESFDLLNGFVDMLDICKKHKIKIEE